MINIERKAEMKKLLLFVIGMLCFVSGVKADLGNYSGKVVSSTIEIGGNFEYEINFTGPNYINETIHYDEELLDYNEFYLNCIDSVECYDDGEVSCKASKIKDGEILLQCDESEHFDYYIPTLSFKAVKSGEASLQIGSEYADGVNIIKAVDNKEAIIEENKNEPTDNIACKDVEETSNIELLTNPFVIGIILGFSIVVVILSVMLSRKNKQIKNVQN